MVYPLDGLIDKILANMGAKVSNQPDDLLISPLISPAHEPAYLGLRSLACKSRACKSRAQPHFPRMQISRAISQEHKAYDMRILGAGASLEERLQAAGH